MPSPLGPERVAALMGELHPDWRVDADARRISRRFEVARFAPAVALANLAAEHADLQGHHPDIAFGWGYCTVSYTTHDVGGLSENDFISAAKLDVLVRSASDR